MKTLDEVLTQLPTIPMGMRRILLRIYKANRQIALNEHLTPAVQVNLETLQNGIAMLLYAGQQQDTKYDNDVQTVIGDFEDGLDVSGQMPTVQDAAEDPERHLTDLNS